MSLLTLIWLKLCFGQPGLAHFDGSFVAWKFIDPWLGAELLAWSTSHPLGDHWLDLSQGAVEKKWSWCPSFTEIAMVSSLSTSSQRAGSGSSFQKSPLVFCCEGVCDPAVEALVWWLARCPWRVIDLAAFHLDLIVLLWYLVKENRANPFPFIFLATFLSVSSAISPLPHFSDILLAFWTKLALVSEISVPWR